ncbi:MAG: DUF1003 domain-containing protein [Acidimicrobiales bacterium]
MTDSPSPRRRRTALDVPRQQRRTLPTPQVDAEVFGRWSETFARFMGTASFLVGMTVFVGVWLAWNTLGPEQYQFDPRRLNFTLLTLILSLQASYAAPLILLAQNRQADRDRVAFEQDRQRAQRTLSDTEYLAREVAALRIALRDVATRDFIRSELRDLLADLEAGRDEPVDGAPGPDRFNQTDAPAGRSPRHEPAPGGRPPGRDRPGPSTHDGGRIVTVSDHLGELRRPPPRRTGPEGPGRNAEDTGPRARDRGR